MSLPQAPSAVLIKVLVSSKDGERTSWSLVTPLVIKRLVNGRTGGYDPLDVVHSVGMILITACCV